MKTKRGQSFLSFLLAFLFCCALFFGISFLVLYEKTPEKSVSSKATVPAAYTEAFCLYIALDEKQYTLDIKPQQAAAFLEPVTAETTRQYDRTITASKTVLRSLCEQLGGIDDTENGQTVHLTGQHFIDLYETQDFERLLKLLLAKAFKSRDTLSITYAVLTKNDATNISYVDFYENAEALVGIAVY
ncbi:MAG: hypothetical protein IJW78_04655 [Clostridia bacterium]|nr:hypothetical protein [Clostridia bacterium]